MLVITYLVVGLCFVLVAVAVYYWAIDHIRDAIVNYTYRQWQRKNDATIRLVLSFVTSTDSEHLKGAEVVIKQLHKCNPATQLPFRQMTTYRARRAYVHYDQLVGAIHGHLNDLRLTCDKDTCIRITILRELLGRPLASSS